MTTQKRIPWPASRLSDPELLATLNQVSIATGKHATVIVLEAVVSRVAELRDRMDDPGSLRRAT